jgi:hypothetical protein
MTGNENNKHTGKRKTEQPAAHLLLLGTIETLLNALIELDEESLARSMALEGLVVRVKVLEPYSVFYLLFTSEGIEVSDDQPGTVKVRLGGRLMDIMAYVVGVTPPEDSHRLRLWGDAESIRLLRGMLQDFNLRTAAQRWLREHVNMDGLWGKMRNHDPSWLTDLLPMPGMMRDTLRELGELKQALRQQQDELARLRTELRQQRRQDLVMLAMAVVAISLGLGGVPLSGTALLQMGGDRIALVVIGIALAASRVRRLV